jgi:hypothetical protein
VIKAYSQNQLDSKASLEEWAEDKVFDKDLVRKVLWGETSLKCDPEVLVVPAIEDKEVQAF